MLGTLLGIGGALVLNLYKGVKITLPHLNIHLLHTPNATATTAQWTAHGNIWGSLLAFLSCVSYASWLIFQVIFPLMINTNKSFSGVWYNKSISRSSFTYGQKSFFIENESCNNQCTLNVLGNMVIFLIQCTIFCSFLDKGQDEAEVPHVLKHCLDVFLWGNPSRHLCFYKGKGFICLESWLEHQTFHSCLFRMSLDSLFFLLA